ncbi:twin-arginine translocase TatA/TatE family subunit [Acetobacter persici]|uniref:twin-arginine translocase TatA/TatE family subunit n=1 Tax=Acetobacter persici TaxID=1076596 RepID=UPI0036DAA5A0
MGSLSIWHWVIVLAVVLVVFGGGKRLSSTMGDLGRGLKVFRREISDLGGDDSVTLLEDERKGHEARAKNEALSS